MSYAARLPYLESASQGYQDAVDGKREAQGLIWADANEIPDAAQAASSLSAAKPGDKVL